jgi:hypothetical protein
MQNVPLSRLLPPISRTNFNLMQRDRGKITTAVTRDSPWHMSMAFTDFIIWQELSSLIPESSGTVASQHHLMPWPPLTKPTFERRKQGRSLFPGLKSSCRTFGISMTTKLSNLLLHSTAQEPFQLSTHLLSFSELADWRHQTSSHQVSPSGPRDLKSSEDYSYRRPSMLIVAESVLVRTEIAHPNFPKVRHAT